MVVLDTIADLFTITTIIILTKIFGQEEKKGREMDPPDGGMIDGTSDLFSRPSIMQYRKESKSPEFRRELALPRESRPVPDSIQNSGASSSQRYLDIINWKPPQNAQVQKLLTKAKSHLNEQNKKETQVENLESTKDKETRPKNVRLMDSPKLHSAGSRRSNLTNKGSHNSEALNRQNQNASELASVSGLSTVSNKSLRAFNIHFDIDTGNQHGWCIAPPPSNELFSKATVRSWEAHRVNELVNRTRSLLAEMSRRNHGLSAPSRESVQQPFARYYENGQREGVSARSTRRTSSRSARSASSRPGSARVSRPQSAVQSENSEDTSSSEPLLIPTENLFLLEVPNSTIDYNRNKAKKQRAESARSTSETKTRKNVCSWILYPDGRTCISKTSNGYVAVYGHMADKNLIGISTSSGLISFSSPPMIFDKCGMRLNNNEQILKWGQIKSPVDVKINRYLRLKAASPRSILLFYEGCGEKYHLNLAEAQSRVAVITNMGQLNSTLGLKSEASEEHAPLTAGETSYNWAANLTRVISNRYQRLCEQERTCKRVCLKASEALRNFVEIHRDSTSSRPASALPAKSFSNVPRPSTAFGNLYLSPFNNNKRNRTNTLLTPANRRLPRTSSHFRYFDNMIIPVMTDETIDTHLKSSTAEQLNVLSVRLKEPGFVPSAANKTIENELLRSRGNPKISIFVYFLDGADPHCATSLLKSRHGIKAGMGVVFVGSRLIFADRIFDGHGADPASFRRELQNCRRRYAEGFQYPKDFKFSDPDEQVPDELVNFSRRTAWGGQIVQIGNSAEQQANRFLNAKTEMMSTVQTLVRLNSSHQLKRTPSLKT